MDFSRLPKAVAERIHAGVCDAESTFASAWKQLLELSHDATRDIHSRDDETPEEFEEGERRGQEAGQVFRFGEQIIIYKHVVEVFFLIANELCIASKDGLVTLTSWELREELKTYRSDLIRETFEHRFSCYGRIPRVSDIPSEHHFFHTCIGKIEKDTRWLSTLSFLKDLATCNERSEVRETTSAVPSDASGYGYGSRYGSVFEDSRLSSGRGAPAETAISTEIPPSETKAMRSRRRRDVVDPLLSAKGLSVYEWEQKAQVSDKTGRRYRDGKTGRLSDSNKAKLAGPLGLAARDLPD